jgi:hypothetical protein
MPVRESIPAWVRSPVRALYIRAYELVVAWGRVRAERRRDSAVRSIRAWVEQRPDELRLNAAIRFCSACSDYPQALQLAEWVLARRDCSAEMVLYYLAVLGVHEFSAQGWTEERLRADPDWFAMVDDWVNGLRSGRYQWRGPFRSDGRELVHMPIEAWRDVPSLQYCDLYRDLESERPTNRILDAFELLGAYSGERVAKTARELLAQKGAR